MTMGDIRLERATGRHDARRAGHVSGAGQTRHCHTVHAKTAMPGKLFDLLFCERITGGGIADRANLQPQFRLTARKVTHVTEQPADGCAEYV